MKFGVLFTSQPNIDTEKHPYHEVHDRVTRQIIEADRLGFDYAWIAEHHFSNAYGILPDPFTYIAYLADKTEQIRFGTAVMTLPLHNVLRLVENASFVDILTGGRLLLGLGSGYRKYEFDGFNVPFEERRDIQAEGLPLILDIFHNRKVNHRGKYFTYDVRGEYEVFPYSLQEPHPPLYIAAATEQSIGLGARYGLGLLLSTLTPIEELARQTAFYRAMCEHTPELYRNNPGFGDVDIARWVYVAETDEKAREESEEGILRHIQSFTHGRVSGYLGTVKGDDQEITYDALLDNVLFHGSPETVIRKITELKEKTGATSMMVHYPPYYSPEQVTKMLRLFAKEVIPAFRQ